jgi:uncharacterized protein
MSAQSIHVYQSLVNFVTFHTSQFDESHDINHALAVYKNALDIADHDYPDVDKDILMYACLLHDVCDHKYSHSLSKEERNTFIDEQFNDTEKSRCVIHVIDNISYSQEVQGKRLILPYPQNIYQDIVSDADKLEALGQVGLQRCITFTLARGGHVPQDVVKHAHEKLLRLKDHFIRTKRGKELAEPLHNVIAEYCLHTTI